jgi:hypothetical protein
MRLSDLTTNIPHLLLNEAQVFNWDKYKQSIVNYITAKLDNKSAISPFYSLIVNHPKVGAANAIGFSDNFQKEWKEHFKFGSNGVWSQVNINDNYEKKSGADRTYNFYVTVAKDADNIVRFMKGIQKLRGHLTQISNKHKTPIKYKTHSLLDAFVDHNDSLKVYYYDPNLEKDIEDAVNAWMKEIGLKSTPRTHTHGVDIKGANGGSFGQILENVITKKLDDLIATYGKKYTPEQYYHWIKTHMADIIKSVKTQK